MVTALIFISFHIGLGANVQKMEAQWVPAKSNTEEICIRDVPEAILEIFFLYAVLSIVSHHRNEII